MNKILGLDLGTNSIGWALRDTGQIGNQIENYSKHSAAHIFYIEPGQDVAFLIKIETNDEFKFKVVDEISSYAKSKGLGISKFGGRTHGSAPTPSCLTSYTLLLTPHSY